MTNEELNEHCARAAHAMNNVLCAVNGDPPSPAWENLTDGQRAGLMRGAEMALAGVHPRQHHENWLRDREAEGWTYGPVKSFEAKTSPCFMPYDELPAAQRVKDALFQASVRAMAEALCAR